jgi:tetratricopeptide (TPR) repeat protein
MSNNLPAAKSLAIRHNLIVLSCLAAILFITSLAYLPGLHGPFVLDDAENISRDPSIAMRELNWEGIQQALGADERAPLKRPLAALTFALNYYWAGGFDTTWYFKVINLVIHTINTVLVYGVAYLLLSSPRPRETLTQPQRQAVALLGTALWAIHPIQLTNVLYVVQRMNSLATLFMLLGLILFMRGRQQLSASPVKALWLMSIGAIGGMMLGIAAKENAALIPLYLLVIEYTLFSRNDLDKRTRHYLYAFYVLSLALPAAVFVIYVTTHPKFITEAFATRQFTAYERLLTETRVLWYYVGLLMVPSTNRLSLFHDDILPSHGLFDPLSTFFAASGITAMLVFSLLYAKRFPVAAFATLWFLVGHSMESTVLDLELVYEHRNYLPSLGPFLAIAYGLIRLTKIESSKRILWYGCAVVLVGMTGISTWVRADSWKDIHTFAVTEAQHHPMSERANDFAARVSLIENHNVGEALRFTLQGLRAAPQEAGFWVDLQILLALLPSQYNYYSVANFPIPSQVTAHETIPRLLREKPVSVHAVVSLENLQRCVVIPPHDCISKREKATEWIILAADESQTSHDYRGILAANAAQILAYNGDYLRAYEYMNRASNALPDLMSYKLAKVEYLLKLGCPDQAGPVLEQIEQLKQSKNMNNLTNQTSLTRLKEIYGTLSKQATDTTHNKHICYKLDK